MRNTITGLIIGFVAGGMVGTIVAIDTDMTAKHEIKMARDGQFNTQMELNACRGIKEASEINAALKRRGIHGVTVAPK